MIDPKQWIVRAPKVGTTDPLAVDFRESMDFALAQRLISVTGIAGAASLEGNETRWVFKPDRPWSRGKHELKVNLALEDLAGNRIDRLFDIDVAETPRKAETTAETISIPFVIN